MRIVFMGTPDIARAALSACLHMAKNNGHEIVGVYTRMDKPVGRKQILSAPPVKQYALEQGLRVLQPRTLRTETAAQELAALQPDLVVVVAYGMILPPDVLAVPRFGCVNLHVSLLPKYRGAAPIQWAVINGEAETGVSIMQIDEGLDTGPVIAQQRVEIAPMATAGDVFELVSEVGAKLLCDTIQHIFAQEIKARPQEGQVTLAPPLTKKMAEIDFSRPAKELHNLVRGCNPWPLAWFTYERKRVKLLQTHPVEASGPCGQVLVVAPLTVACGQGALVFEQLHPEGARPMTGEQWAMGRRFAVGAQLQ